LTLADDKDFGGDPYNSTGQQRSARAELQLQRFLYGHAVLDLNRLGAAKLTDFDDGARTRHDEFRLLFR